jgi:hypothetical protein
MLVTLLGLAPRRRVLHHLSTLPLVWRSNTSARGEVLLQEILQSRHVPSLSRRGWLQRNELQRHFDL